jgi:hypothetical protein
MDYWISILQLVKYKPVVKRVYKSSIMGNEFNKTYDYYFSKIIVSPLDDTYTIDYIFKGKSYIIKTRVENLQDALDYVEKGSFEELGDEITMAFESTGFDTFRDLTEHVRKFYGPSKDFYSNDTFKVYRKFITKNKLYIVDKKYHIHSFEEDDDIVDIFKDAKKLV